MREMALTSTRRIVRYENGQLTERDDSVVTEYPLTLLLNGDEFATLVCSPDWLEDLAVGFLASEGVVASYADIVSVALDEKDGFAHIEVERLNPYYAAGHSKRYIASCCGKSRQGFYFWNDVRTVRPVAVDSTLSLTYEDCLRLMEELHHSSGTFRATGGVHNAALCDQGGVRLARTDIGRHNALDKLYGHCLRHELSPAGMAMAFSGRVSSEILLKTAKIGCGIVLSKSAPTLLALELAEQLGITVVGFIRGQSLNVYTHPERLRLG